jgi:segregation and condensation protein B
MASKSQSDPHEEPISLKKLSESFARLFAPAVRETPAEEADAAAIVPEAPPQDEEPAADGAAEEAVDGDALVEDTGEVTPRSILEAMLFVGSPDNAPLTAEQAAGVMRGVKPEEIDELVQDLNRQYAADGCPYTIASHDAGYTLVLRPEFYALRDRFLGRRRQARLSQAAVDVLAIVAYNEPLTGDDVARLRGTPSGAVLSQLVRRQLLRIERPQESPQKPRYYTTPRFLELFGLESLADLPHSQDIDQR